MRRTLGPAVIAALLLSTQVSTASPPPAVGCTSYPVVAHLAGGKVIPVLHLPRACATLTGYATSEPTLAVTPNGTVVMSPAETENSSVRSTDGGRSWALTQPAKEQYTSLWNTVDPNITVDRRTGRLYLVHATGPTRTTPLLVDESPLPPQAAGVSTALAAAYGFQVYSSGDDGRTWTTADYQTAPVGDWEKVFVGPSRGGHGSTVYVCGNSPFEVIGPGRLCYRSHDSGRTFSPAAFVFPSPTQPKDCPALGANNGTVGPDGTVYQPVSCTDGSYVAVSTDEGDTYTWHAVPGTAGTGTGLSGQSFQVVADAGGTVYAGWMDGDALRLSRSVDHGASWTSLGNVAVPGAHTIALAQMAAGAAGQVGFAYYAATWAGQSDLTLYVTETLTGNDRRPVLVSAALTDPAHPGFQNLGLGGPSPRADYIGAAFDGAGRLWAAAVRQTSAPRPDGTIGTVGIVGHLSAAPARR